MTVDFTFEQLQCVKNAEDVLVWLYFLLLLIK